MRQPGAKAFVIYNKKILMILRDNIPTIPSPNTWSLPGGGIENGESALEGLQRELQEEISVIPKDIKHLGQQKYPNNSTVDRFFVNLTEDEFLKVKLGDEGQRLDFFTFDQLLILDHSPFYQDYFNTYKKAIKQLIEKNKIPDKKELGLE